VGTQQQVLQQGQAGAALLGQERRVQPDKLLEGIEHTAHQRQNAPLGAFNFENLFGQRYQFFFLAVDDGCHLAVVQRQLIRFRAQLPVFVQQLLGLIVQLLDFLDRKSTRLNSSHVKISYAVFCLKKKKKT